MADIAEAHSAEGWISGRVPEQLFLSPRVLAQYRHLIFNKLLQDWKKFSPASVGSFQCFSKV